MSVGIIATLNNDQTVTFTAPTDLKLRINVNAIASGGRLTVNGSSVFCYGVIAPGDSGSETLTIFVGMGQSVTVATVNDCRATVSMYGG
jgi:hypothetical protein